MNMIKVLRCRFQLCFGPFTILLVQDSSETGLFRHLSDYVFGVRNFENAKSIRVLFCFKMLKFNLDFQMAAKHSEKLFCFWDNCIWFGIVKLSLLRRGYFSSVANALTSSPKIWHVNRRDCFDQNFVASEWWIW